MSAKVNDTYTVLFQMGNMLNYRWMRYANTYSRYDEADKACRDHIRDEGPALVYITRELDSNGGPDDFAEVVNGKVRFTGITHETARDSQHA